ncbi:hypothetical protein C0J52_26524 [Blattella germanica]|nr:hypothetical protein C0J52_26524 [Blattella germanica]
MASVYKTQCFVALVVLAYLGSAHTASFFLGPVVYGGSGFCGDDGICRYDCEVFLVSPGNFQGVCRDNGQDITCNDDTPCPASCTDTCKTIYETKKAPDQ